MPLCLLLGTLCDVDLCDFKQCVHGVCELGICVCYLSGTLCDVDLCDFVQCVHGVCELGICVCEEGYSGSLCTEWVQNIIFFLPGAGQQTSLAIHYRSLPNWETGPHINLNNLTNINFLQSDHSYWCYWYFWTLGTCKCKFDKKKHSLWVPPTSYSSIVSFARQNARYIKASQSSRRQCIEIPIRSVFDLVTLTFDLWPWPFNLP